VLRAKIKILVCTTGFLLLAGLTFAQETAPWPPDPAEIFAPGVEVVNVEINLLPVADDKARTIQVLDAQTQAWKPFNYPVEVKSASIRNVENGLVLLNVLEQNATTPHLWTLDPTSGTFQRYENPCIDWEWHAQHGPPITSLIPHWEYYRDASIGRTSLCYTGTEQSNFLLPKGTHWHSISEAPDGKWLLLLSSDDEDLSTRSTFHAYGYSIESKQLHYLGDFPLLPDNSLRWLSGSRGIYRIADRPEYSTRAYYYFDLNQADSLRYVITGWADYHDDPPRYEYLQSYYEVTHRVDTFGNYPECEVEIYYLPQEQIESYHYLLSKDCFGNVVRNQTTYFYAGYSTDETAMLTLYSLNIENGEQTEWFSDQNLLALDSVSPDGRYAVLMLNDGRWPDVGLGSDYTSERSIPLEDLDPWGYDGIGSSHVAIYDLVERRLAYENDQWEDYGATIWLDESTFLSIDNQGMRPIYRFHLTETGLVRDEIKLPEQGGPWFSPNYQSAGFFQGAQVQVYQFMSDRMIPIIDDLHSDYYEIVGLNWIDNEQLSINLAPIERGMFYNEPTVIYTIRIPQTES
jgi:hypothetical protein